VNFSEKSAFLTGSKFGERDFDRIEADAELMKPTIET
jgi:hypothetical protein